MDIHSPKETEEQQVEIRKSLNEANRINAEAETKFNNSWRKQLERKINRK